MVELRPNIQRLEITSTVSDIFIPTDVPFILKADSGNTQPIYIRFGSENAQSSGNLQGFPLFANESLVDQLGKYSGRISFVVASSTMVLWYIPELSTLLTNIDLIQTFSTDTIAVSSLPSVITKNTLYDPVNNVSIRTRSHNSVAQTSVANTANVLSISMFNLRGALVLEASVSGGTFSGNLTVECSIDDFATVTKTLTIALPAAATANTIYPNAVTYRALANLSDAVMSEGVTSYPYLRFTLPAQGAGITTTLTLTTK